MFPNLTKSSTSKIEWVKSLSVLFSEKEKGAEPWQKEHRKQATSVGSIPASSQAEAVVTTRWPLVGAAFPDLSSACRCAKPPYRLGCCRRDRTSWTPSFCTCEPTTHQRRDWPYSGELGWRVSNWGCNSCLQAAFMPFSVRRKPCQSGRWAALLGACLLEFRNVKSRAAATDYFSNWGFCRLFWGLIE